MHIFSSSRAARRIARHRSRHLLILLLLLAAVLVCALWPTNAFAQFKGLNQADMQGMMQAAQNAQKCFAGIDQSALQRLADEGEMLQHDVRQLCRAGNWREAEEQALAYGHRIAKDANVVAVRKCGQAMAGMLPELPFADIEPEESLGQSHFCDEY